MTERLIDAVCPHCGRVGTTVRVVLREDGHTKLSRRCTDCGGECIHTFDHDWLAAANNKKLRAENEKLRAEIERMRAALTSIASNTCCDGCQEAARVARNVLEAKP